MRFKKGDYVRIRSWEEMKKEYGVGEDGEVDIPQCSFTEGMKDYCGEIREVSVADDRDDTYQMKGIDFYWFPEDSLVPAKKQRELRKGDKVLVRSWDSMKEEFGTDDDGDIDTVPCFATSMRRYCGEEMTVSDAGISFVNLEGASGYCFSPKHVTLIEPSENTGLASDQEHYKASAMQPLEVMQTFFTPEQFKGFLLGNFVKYTMRAMHKGQAESDHDKAKQYLYWYSLVKNDADYRISPETDVPDDDFTGEGAFA
ncbi:hypothetical protein SELR_pSRC300880 (plasmid) [Selenomonas ruminantium subsp. lactilytica TAM6421]|uniref:DUF3310 domain-containing protein n=1 Tax=Selenomonas ruminantium subsp. lactilytica (strain NBRC 103574 / TAM6421) TaxID=927704 RepID=I0GWM4_SELRL|nr:DUF3310 domain-containing protein [Selenomonas ruminantium]BAL85161.1 hypothetical protein SELR_pSRC300880 [Selenomonas ruminantium subsp. lactilytica TAM6421]